MFGDGFHHFGFRVVVLSPDGFSIVMEKVENASRQRDIQSIISAKHQWSTRQGNEW